MDHNLRDLQVLAGPPTGMIRIGSLLGTGVLIRRRKIPWILAIRTIYLVFVFTAFRKILKVGPQFSISSRSFLMGILGGEIDLKDLPNDPHTGLGNG